MKALKFAILSIVVFFITNNAFAQINLTTYKGGDKELIRHIEKNIKHPETEFIEGGLSIVFAKIIFNRQGFIDSFKISVNNNNPFGKSILLALNKSKENWQKNKNLPSIIIPFLFIDGDSRNGKMPFDYKYDFINQKEFFNIKTVVLNPIIFTRLHDTIY